MEQTLTLEQLKALCERYDSAYGNWPESKYEGGAVYDFVVAELGQGSLKTE